MNDLDEEITWLSRLVMARYAREGIPVERVDCGSGAIVSDRFILDELGDFLQNVAALTPLCGDASGIAWALRLVRTTRHPRFRRGGLFETFAFPTRRWRRLQGMGLAFPYWNLDTLTGLVALHELLARTGHEAEAAEVAADVRGVITALAERAMRHGLLRYGYHPGSGISLPLVSPQLTGYVAEELIRFGAISGEPGIVALAGALLRAECATPAFRERGLFCAQVLGPAAPILRTGLRRLGKRHFFDPMLTKDNTLPAFALLALERLMPAGADWARGARRRWREAVDAHFRTGDGDYRTFAGAASEARLTFNHSMIELEIETYVQTGDAAALECAERLSRRWLSLQTPRGLVAEGAGTAWRRRAFLDPQVDLAIDLLKLGELTGHAAWTDAARAIFTAIRRDFRLPAGYAWEVDAETGDVRETVIEVKYLGLLLKGYLALREVEAGRSLRGSPLVWMLLRDR